MFEIKQSVIDLILHDTEIHLSKEEYLSAIGSVQVIDNDRYNFCRYVGTRILAIGKFAGTIVHIKWIRLFACLHFFPN